MWGQSWPELPLALKAQPLKQKTYLPTNSIHAAHVAPHVTASTHFSWHRVPRPEYGRHAAQHRLPADGSGSRLADALSRTWISLRRFLIEAIGIVVVIVLVIVVVVLLIVVFAVIIVVCLAFPPPPDLWHVIVPVVTCYPELLRGRHQLPLRVRTLGGHKAAGPASLTLKQESWTRDMASRQGFGLKIHTPASMEYWRRNASVVRFPRKVPAVRSARVEMPRMNTESLSWLFSDL